MTVGRIITLSALFAQVLSAPNGCIESCTSYHRQESYRSHHASGGSEGSVQGSVNPESLNLDFSRPGNWTEHNEYRTDGGHGRVHEEQGQYVTGPKKVRFYKKNYTSAYSTGVNGGGGYEDSGQLNTDHTHSSQHAGGQHYYGSQNTYDQSRHEYGYNRVHNEGLQSSSRRVNTHSERLEDFGEYGSSSQVEHGSQDQHRYDQRPGTWSKVDSYKTDGGRGQVFEEQGQYVTGPKTVRYFRKNYTSSYSSGGPIPEVGAIRSESINKELQKLHEEFNREVQKISNTEHVNTLNTANLVQEGTTGFGSEIRSTDYRPRVPTTGPTYTYPETSHGNYGSESHSSYESQQTHVSTTNPKPQAHLIRVPLYRRTHDISTAQEAERLNHNGYDQQGSTYSRPGQVRRYEERWSSSSHTRESVPSVDVQTEQIGSSQYRNQHSGHHSSYATQGHNTYVGQSAENNFNSAYRAVPSQAVVGTLDLGQVSQSSVDCTQETAGQVQYGSHYVKRYRREAGDNQQQQESQDLEQLSQLTQLEQLTQQNEDQSHDQLHQQETQHEDLGQETGHIELGQHTQQTGDDFTQQTGGLELGQQTGDDFTQQTGGLELGQQTGDDFTQQTGGLELGQQTGDDFTQQTGGLELGQHTQQTGDDFTQQTGGLELGQHTHQTGEDFTQQTGEDFTQQTGGLEFGQHTQQSEDMTQQVSLRRKRQINNPYYVDEDLKQQAGGFDEFMQQMGSLGFEQETQKPQNRGIPPVRNQRLEDFNQENEDLAQQTGGFDDFSQQAGKLDFGEESQKPFKPERPPVGNQHFDHTQQNDDLTQQTGGFDDFSQQTGHLEFGQQPQKPFKPERPPVGSQHLDLTQQNDDLTQQTGGFDDFTQQTGHLEFGQQTQKPKPGKSPADNQDFEDLTQQTGGFDDFSQQTGHLEFGQQPQKPFKPERPPVGSQHLDLTQQNEDLTQQTGGFDDFSQQTGHLEFGQEPQKPFKPERLSVGNQHLDHPQQNDDLTQQTGGFDDFSQQTGHLEFGQQPQKPFKPERPPVGSQHLDLTQQNEDLTQQTGGFDDFTQQTGHLEFGQQTQKPKPGKLPADNQDFEDLTQQTGGFDDFSQQTGHLEFGQEPQKPFKPERPSVGNQHLDHPQQNDDLTQQTGGFDDFSQQTGHLEFGQQPQKPFKPERPPVGSQHLDLTQQNEDLTQQTGGFDDFTQQTGHLEFGQQTQKPKPGKSPADNEDFEDLTQQTGGFDDLSQQTGGFDDFSQQPGHLEFGQQPQKPLKPERPPVGNQRLDITQQNEGLIHRTGRFDDFMQQTRHLESGQQTQSPYKPNESPVYHQHSGDFTQQNQDLSQQTGGFDDFSQQTGHFEFGQQRQNPYEPTVRPVGSQSIGLLSRRLSPTESFPTNERNKPFNHNSPKTDDDVPGVIGLTTESSQSNQQTEADDMEEINQNQNPTPSIQKPAPKPNPRPRFYDLKPLQFGVSSEAETTVNPYDQTVSQNIERNPNQRYYPQRNDDGIDTALQTGQSNTDPWKVDTNSGSKAVEVTNEADVDEGKRDTSRADQHPQNPDNLTTTPSSASNPDDSRKFTKTGRRPGQRREHFYHVNWPKADNAFAIQWHLMHQPSDLSNSEGQYSHVQQSYQQSMRHHSSQTYYGQNYQEQNRDVQQQSEPIYHQQNMQHVQTAQGMNIMDPHHQEMNQQRQLYYNNNGQQQGWYEQSQLYKSNHPNQEQAPNQVQSSYVSPDQIGNTQTNSPIDIEPRFIEVYGGKGPYDATHRQDIFDKVAANPSATFAPDREGPDSWEIREKPEETYILKRTTTTEATTTEQESDTTTAAPQNFWQRVGSSLTNTYGKARDKAREIFG